MRILTSTILLAALFSTQACDRKDDYKAARWAAWQQIRTGHLDQALPHARRAIELARAGDQPNQDLANALVVGGWLCLHLECDQDALAWLSEALPLRAEVLKVDDPWLAQVHSLLGVALSRQGKERYAEAEAAHTKALAIRLKVRGPQHPEVATSLNNLGVLARR